VSGQNLSVEGSVLYVSRILKIDVYEVAAAKIFERKYPCIMAVVETPWKRSMLTCSGLFSLPNPYGRFNGYMKRTCDAASVRNEIFRDNNDRFVN
jgi:hypothetical protein